MSALVDDERRAVGVRSRIRIRDAEGAEEEFTIVPREEAEPMRGRISVDCPLAQALLGKRVGDRVRVRAPGGLRGVIVLAVT